MSLNRPIARVNRFVGFTTVKEITGHSSLQVLDRHAHARDNDKLDAVEIAARPLAKVVKIR